MSIPNLNARVNTIDFNSFLDAANKAKDPGGLGGKGVICLNRGINNLNPETETISVGTREWQTLGSRSDTYKLQNREARTMLLQALKAKYEVNDVYRLPKPVLDALEISNFDLDKGGNVRSMRPLTARRIIAIDTAMRSCETSSESALRKDLTSKVNEIKATVNDMNYKLTADDNPQWVQLLKLNVLDPKGRVLVRYPGNFNVERTATCFEFETVKSERVDTRFGARLDLFRTLVMACGPDEDFMNDAIRQLKLDSHNPVYENIPLDVAQGLIRRAIEIRKTCGIEIEAAEKQGQKGKREVSLKAYNNLIKANKKVLAAKLGDVVDKLKFQLGAYQQALEDRSMAAGLGKSYARMARRLEDVIRDLEKDLKKTIAERSKDDYKGSDAYKNIVYTLADVGYAYLFPRCSQASQLEFLLSAAQGTVEKLDGETERVFYRVDKETKEEVEWEFARQITGYEAETKGAYMNYVLPGGLRRPEEPNAPQEPMNVQ